MKTNPLNIRHSRELFLGELKSNSKFKVFVNRTYGVRAAFIIISNYRKYGVFTVKDIITRWAPPTENKTSAYIDFVCTHAKFNSDSLINTQELFLKLVHAMAIYESNINLTNKCLLDAWNMAFPQPASK